MAENIYLAGPYTPVQAELCVTKLEVIGEIPEQLDGQLLRNGPNPRRIDDPQRHHWFDGEGMVHGVRLRGGRAEWYRNRFVAPPALDSDDPEDEPFGPNTQIIAFAGRLLALVEGGPPAVELNAQLESPRVFDFAGTRPHGFTAHPKLDPATGRMHAMCYDWTRLEHEIEYLVVAPDGRVERTQSIALRGPSMVHDMSITASSALVYDLPVIADAELAEAGTFPFRWHSDYGARVGVLPLGGGEPIWCEVEPCYVYHPVNAYDDDEGRIVVDLCRYERMFVGDDQGPWRDSLPTLARWTIDPRSGRVREEEVYGGPVEFPRIRDELVGRRHRYAYTSTTSPVGPLGPTCKHDFRTGATQQHDHGPGRGASEPAFVAREGGVDEDDGFLLSYVHNHAGARDELVILDARELSQPPLARILLPGRVPLGFHGSWIPDAALGASAELGGRLRRAKRPPHPRPARPGALD